MNCANHPDRERKAFCQNCGKPLCVECARTVGQAVFCEPCLEIRLAAANVAAAGAAAPFGSGPTARASSSYQAVPGANASYTYTGPTDGVSPTTGSVASPPGSPNPSIAFLFGFIPGVGAMYNGQYAKGVVHLIIFAVLVSLAGENGIFGLFVAGWLFYQAFEAHHTARARRDGTPLPNHFGLNDIGERLGFGRSWPPTSAGPLGGSSTATPPVQPPPSATSYAPPVEAAYTAPGPGFSSSTYADRPMPTAEPAWGAPTNAFAAVPPVAPLPSANQFPVGALVLIGLGVLFLIGSTHMFVGLPVHYLLPFLLIGVGVYLFVRRMTASGVGFVDDGSVAYRLRLVRALQSSVWVVLVGVLFLLDTLRILSWGRSWPLFIIVGGVMAFVQRSASASAAPQMPFTPYAAAPPPPQSASAPPESAPADPGSALAQHDREGS